MKTIEQFDNKTASEYGYRYINQFLGCTVEYTDMAGNTHTGIISERESDNTFGRAVCLEEGLIVYLYIQFDDGRWTPLPDEFTMVHI